MAFGRRILGNSGGNDGPLGMGIIPKVKAKVEGVTSGSGMLKNRPKLLK